MDFTMRGSHHHESRSPSGASARLGAHDSRRFTGSRRSARLAAVGGVLTVLAVATFSPRSHAAGKEHDASPYGAPATRARGFGLLPLFARRDVPLFGAFIKPGGSPDVAPSDTACPPDMTEVEGEYCPFVEQRCTRWLDPATKLQCAEFDRAPAQTMGARCSMKTEHKKFCIDRYEWPNKEGALPETMASWVEAKTTCEGIGKRLCADTEWTLACEGPEHHPYPYGEGFSRDGAACNIDKPYIWPRPEKVYDPQSSAEELARLDQREPSGARAACVSPYGVHDLTGNVDEWVVNVSQSGLPHASGLKGGYWGPVRTRCRAMTTAHAETFRYYQIGFRCCGAARPVDVGQAPLASE
jgi:sulfatase modifying factor 1